MSDDNERNYVPKKPKRLWELLKSGKGFVLYNDGTTEEDVRKAQAYERFLRENNFPKDGSKKEIACRFMTDIYMLNIFSKDFPFSCRAIERIL